MAEAFSRGGLENGLAWALLGTLGPAVIGLAALIVLGRIVLRPFFHFVAETNSPEFFMAACLLVVLGDGLAAAASHLSMAIGAFVAGLLLAETEYRREIEVTIEPFKGLLLGLYFVSVGAGIDPRLIYDRPAVIFGIAIALIAVKGVILVRPRAGLPRAVAHGRRDGAAARVRRRVRLRDDRGGLRGRPCRPGAFHDPRQRGDALDGRDPGARPDRRAHRIGAETEGRRAAEEPPPESEAGRVVIVGYGRVGTLVGEMLEVHRIPYIAIDSNARLVAGARTEGKPVYYGDASRARLSAPLRHRYGACARRDDG